MQAQDLAFVSLIIYWVFSAAVSAMPTPTISDSKKYQFAFHFLRILAGDLSQVIGSRIPKP